MKRFIPILLTTDAEQALDIFLTDPFHYFTLDGLANDPAMQDMAASIFQTAQVLGLCALVLSLMWGIIKWGITSPAKKKEGLVSVVGWKLFMVAFIAAFVEIIGFFIILYERIAGTLG